VICGSVVAEFERQINQTRPHFNVSEQNPPQPNMIFLWNLFPAPSFHLIGVLTMTPAPGIFIVMKECLRCFPPPFLDLYFLGPPPPPGWDPARPPRVLKRSLLLACRGIQVSRSPAPAGVVVAEQPERNVAYAFFLSPLQGSMGVLKIRLGRDGWSGSGQSPNPPISCTLFNHAYALSFVRPPSREAKSLQLCTCKLIFLGGVYSHLIRKGYSQGVQASF